MIRMTAQLIVAMALMVLAPFGLPYAEPPSVDSRSEVRWVEAVNVETDSKVRFNGRTRFGVSRSALIEAGAVVRVGDELQGVRIGAIRCSYHDRDASHGGVQYMWRGRWACMAGRSRREVENAVDPRGGRRHDYIHVAPVTLR
jgi:hypothetical protein